MTIVWSLPIRGERLDSSRGDVVRARSLIEALRAEGHDVLVVASADRSFHRLAVDGYRRCLRDWLPPGTKAAVRDVGRVVQGALHGVRVARTARRARADVVVETQVACAVSGAVASRLAHAPLVLDDCSPSCEELAFGDSLQWLARGVLAIQGRAARAVIAASPALGARLAAEGVPESKITVVPNGLRVDAYAADTLRKALPRGWPAGRCLVGFVGSFQPWHRVELLIDAVAELPESLSLHVVLVGEGPGLAAALDVARARGLGERLTVTGAVPAERVPGLVGLLDIGVLPDSNEYGHPMKLVEYAAAGVPAVGPDLPPVREVVDDLATGLIFPRGNVKALAAAIARLASDPALRGRMGRLARQRALAAGSWTDRARALLGSIGLDDDRRSSRSWTQARSAPAAGSRANGAQEPSDAVG